MAVDAHASDAPAATRRPRERATAHGSYERGRAPGWLYAVLTAGLVLMLLPFAWMLLSSVKPPADILAHPSSWIPADLTAGNYARLTSRLDIDRYFVNSTVVATAITLGNVAFGTMLGYALAKLEFRGRRLLFLVVMGTLMVPGVVTFVPLFVLVTNLGLGNSLPGMFLPFLAAPFGVFLMRQFILGLPDDLIQAARVDGASELRIFTAVIVPLCGPALATLAILTFLGSWNQFLWPLVVAQTEDKYTLPVGLALAAVGQHSTDYGLLLAGAVVVVIPVIAIFLLLQRYFVQGIATTGIK